MPRSNPRGIFGIHMITPYNRVTGVPYGFLEVVGGSTLSVSGETIDLMGGSSKFAYASEDGPSSAEMTWKIREYPDFIFQLFGGIAPTVGAAEALGGINALTNRYGTSVMNGTTGVAGVTILAGSEADLKRGKYVVRAASATTVDVFILSDVDTDRGTDGTIYDDNGKINATPLTITSAGFTTVPNFGIRLGGGSGAIAMTVGDTATFEVRPPNSRNTSIVIGGLGDTYPEFGCLMVAQKRSNGEMFEIDAFRCKGAAGLPLDLSENKWSETELKIKLLHDSAKNGVYGLNIFTP